LAALYVPSLYDLLTGIWSTDEQKHCPIVLGVSCWLVWRNWPTMWARSEGAQTSAAGWPVVVVGLLLYIVGRSQEILMFEVGSLIWLLIGILLLMRGGATTAKEEPRWTPRITFANLVAEIIHEDLKRAERYELVKKHGYKLMDYNG